MSKLHAVPAQSIPTGILVSATPKTCPAERPTPKRKVAPRARARQIPWLWIVTLGSVAWAAMILTIGLCTGNQERSQPGEPAVAQPIAAAEPARAPQPLVQAEPLALPDFAEPADEPEPRAEPQTALKLAMRVLQVGRNDDLPPPIQIEPKPVLTILREEVKPQEPGGVKDQARPLRKDIDLTVFASCEQIGTNVLFMKSPADAFKKAREEKKLVFIVHLSGNLEDKEFT